MISKEQAKRHRRALDLVELPRALDSRERDFVLGNFHEGAKHMNRLAGAFFTPEGLARDFSIEAGPLADGKRVLDLCAGIGRLSAPLVDYASEVVCVEINPEYAEVGEAAVPKARWVVADALGDLSWLGQFDLVISNPPWGRVGGHRYFELALVEAAAKLARFGVFLLPQQSTPHRYSGKRAYEKELTPAFKAWQRRTGIVMEMNCGIDTEVYRGEWKVSAPTSEIVIVDYKDPEE